MSERFSNIKNIAMEPERKPERPFDPRRDITEAQWNAMADKRMEWVQIKENLDSVLYIAALEKLVKGIDSSRDVAAFVEPIEEMDAYSWEAYLESRAYEKIAGLDAPVSDVHWERIQRARERHAINGFHDRIGRMYAYEAILGRSVSVSFTAWQNIERYVKDNFLNSEWAQYITTAAAARILGKKIEIPEDVKKNISESRTRAEQFDHWDLFARLSIAESILSADEVIIPKGGGLKLVWRDRPESETPAPRPSQRNF